MSTLLAPRYRGKAEQAANAILAAFQSGNLPEALAPVFIRRKEPNVPCRQWSWANQLLVALSGHSDARGFRQWQAVGRFVRKGEKSFPILVPIVRKRTDRDTETGDETERTFCAGFSSAAVFGLSQTDGQPLAPPDPAIAQWIDSLPLVEVARQWGLSVETYNGAAGKAHGMYRGREAIALGVKNLSVWAHELIHAADDRLGTLSDRGNGRWKSETVAELGAAVLLELIGRPDESNRGGAFEYVQAYASAAGLEVVTACQRVLARTCDCVALILDSAEALSAEAA